MLITVRNVKIFSAISFSTKRMLFDYIFYDAIDMSCSIMSALGSGDLNLASQIEKEIQLLNDIYS